VNDWEELSLPGFIGLIADGPNPEFSLGHSEAADERPSVEGLLEQQGLQFTGDRASPGEGQRL
jgi:hypothetical protein